MNSPFLLTLLLLPGLACAAPTAGHKPAAKKKVSAAKKAAAKQPNKKVHAVDKNTKARQNVVLGELGDASEAFKIKKPAAVPKPPNTKPAKAMTSDSKKNHKAHDRAVKEEVKPPATSLIQKKEQVSQKVMGELDTVNGSGNWVAMKGIRRKAQSAIKQMRQIIKSIPNSQQSLSSKQQDLRKKLSSFYIEMGTEQGVLEEKLRDLEKDIENERKDQGDLTLKERNVARRVKIENELLDRTQSDLKQIHEFQDSVDKAINALEDQEKLAQNYLDKSYDLYDRIEILLDDIKATQLLNEMSAYLKSMQAIASYGSNRLNAYVQKNVSDAQTVMGDLKQQIIKLKAAGVSLEKQADKDLNEDDAARAVADRDKRDEAARKNAMAQRGFLGRWYDQVSSIVHQLYNASQVVIHFVEGRVVAVCSNLKGHVVVSYGYVHNKIKGLFGKNKQVKKAIQEPNKETKKS
ncbi:hypothetical protein HOL34_01000 [bacterium]|jgi:hypothetical protein|nr:hypothetical protein [bacterium]MBT3903707.1 hypothetical protein [bacterium]MBT4577521.1 hypothetical protein [bacterium]MBT5345888.1 hypothetical protein [bacterium]MBT6131091.1 hypothetical protein [bacterium]